MKKIAGRIVWALMSLAAGVLSGGYRRESRRAGEQLLDRSGGGVHLLVGYRFYAKFIAAKVMALDDKRATPAERLRDGHDYEPTNKWILFGHHFAAIAGPGSAGGPDAGRAVRLSAQRVLDHHRRGAGRRGAGFRDSVLLHAARRQDAGPDGPRRDRESRADSRRCSPCC